MSFGSENQKPNPQQPAPQAPSFQPQPQPTETLYPAQGPAQGWGAPQPGQQPQGWGAPPQPGQQPQGWGAVPPGSPGARKGALARMTPVQKGLAAAGVAVVIAGGAGAAVYAATNAGNAANAANQGFAGGPGGAAGQGQAGSGANGGFQGGFGGPGNLGVGAAGQAVHGEYVVQRNGQYVTELEQSGTITSVSSGKITVKSGDGFEQSYAITSDTAIASFGGRGNRGQGQSQSQQGSLSASSLASGQTVRVTALKDGNSALSILVSSTTGTSSGTSGSGGSTGQSN